MWGGVEEGRGGETGEVCRIYEGEIEVAVLGDRYSKGQVGGRVHWGACTTGG